jgi:hypothetical protein
VLKQHQRQGEEDTLPKRGDASGLRALPAWLDAFLEKASKERQKAAPVVPRNAFAKEFAQLQADREATEERRSPHAARTSPLQDRRFQEGGASTGGVGEFVVVEVPVPRDQVK